jgi:hypothetical protein
MTWAIDTKSQKYSVHNSLTEEAIAIARKRKGSEGSRVHLWTATESMDKIGYFIAVGDSRFLAFWVKCLAAMPFLKLMLM